MAVSVPALTALHNVLTSTWCDSSCSGSGNASHSARRVPVNAIRRPFIVGCLPLFWRPGADCRFLHEGSSPLLVGPGGADPLDQRHRINGVGEVAGGLASFF